MHNYICQLNLFLHSKLLFNSTILLHLFFNHYSTVTIESLVPLKCVKLNVTADCFKWHRCLLPERAPWPWWCSSVPPSPLLCCSQHFFSPSLGADQPQSPSSVLIYIYLIESGLGVPGRARCSLWASVSNGLRIKWMFNCNYKSPCA